MLKFIVLLLGVPKEGSGQGSGKREMATLFAIFTGTLVVWSWSAFGEEARLTVIGWLISASVVMLLGAFGMEALISQAGLKFTRKAREDDNG